MKITKPDDVLFLQGFIARGGQAYLVATVGYALDAAGRRLSEQDAWQWLTPQFKDEPFDLAQKKARGTYAVEGSAFAPGGRPCTAMAVRARIGTQEKILHVHG